jgi:opacity protein-like surface antigen
VKKTVLLAAVTMALLFASVALADDSSLLSGYGGQEVVQAQVSGQQTQVSGAQKGPAKGTLPFTGLDLLPMFAGGVALVLAGVALRRRTRQRS